MKIQDYTEPWFRIDTIIVTLVPFVKRHSEVIFMVEVRTGSTGSLDAVAPRELLPHRNLCLDTVPDRSVQMHAVEAVDLLDARG